MEHISCDSPFSTDETGTDNKDKVGWLWLTLTREANQVQVVLVARGGGVTKSEVTFASQLEVEGEEAVQELFCTIAEPYPATSPQYINKHESSKKQRLTPTF